jgi:hypothetical protein
LTDTTHTKKVSSNGVGCADAMRITRPPLYEDPQNQNPFFVFWTHIVESFSWDFEVRIIKKEIKKDPQ